MATIRPAGLPSIDARPPKGTPARAQLERDAAWLVTPYAGIPLPRALEGVPDTPTPKTKAAVETRLARILADRREKRLAPPQEQD